MGTLSCCLVSERRVSVIGRWPLPTESGNVDPAPRREVEAHVRFEVASDCLAHCAMRVGKPGRIKEVERDGCHGLNDGIASFLYLQGISMECVGC